MCKHRAVLCWPLAVSLIHSWTFFQVSNWRLTSLFLIAEWYGCFLIYLTDFLWWTFGSIPISSNINNVVMNIIVLLSFLTYLIPPIKYGRVKLDGQTQTCLQFWSSWRLGKSSRSPGVCFQPDWQEGLISFVFSFRLTRDKQFPSQFYAWFSHCRWR